VSGILHIDASLTIKSRHTCPEPDRKFVVADNEVLVLGHYRGDGWESPFVGRLAAWIAAERPDPVSSC
jgi:hypothetical protein